MTTGSYQITIVVDGLRVPASAFRFASEEAAKHIARMCHDASAFVIHVDAAPSGYDADNDTRALADGVTAGLVGLAELAQLVCRKQG